MGCSKLLSMSSETSREPACHINQHLKEQGSLAGSHRSKNQEGVSLGQFQIVVQKTCEQCAQRLHSTLKANASCAV